MRTVTILASLLFMAISWGHHSDAGLDMDNITIVEGTVTGYYFRNPHVYFTVAVPDASGETVEWSMQMGSAITSARRGWTPDSLVEGDVVRVEIHASVDGRPYGIADYVDKEGGVISNAPFYEPAETASTDSLEGLWMAVSSELVVYPGGFDGFFRAQLTLNGKALAAQASYDELSAENPNSTCVGRPTPAMIVMSAYYPLEIEFLDNDIIAIRREFYDEERLVYMDGRAHPDVSQRFDRGHSIGFWDGDVLVVDTRNFSDNRSPYQIGVPSGAEKHVVERYELADDGQSVFVEFVLEDPEYLIGSMTHRRELVYAPDYEMMSFECDIESSRRFILN